jgi:hypothetical protein
MAGAAQRSSGGRGGTEEKSAGAASIAGVANAGDEQKTLILSLFSLLARGLLELWWKSYRPLRPLSEFDHVACPRRRVNGLGRPAVTDLILEGLVRANNELQPGRGKPIRRRP